MTRCIIRLTGALPPTPPLCRLRASPVRLAIMPQGLGRRRNSSSLAMFVPQSHKLNGKARPAFTNGSHLRLWRTCALSYHRVVQEGGIHCVKIVWPNGSVHYYLCVGKNVTDTIEGRAAAGTR
jgi:hypothetical protein